MINFGFNKDSVPSVEKTDGSLVLLKNRLRDEKDIVFDDIPSLSQFYNYYTEQEVGLCLVEKNNAEKVIELQGELKGKENEDIDLNIAEKLFTAGLIKEVDLENYKNSLSTDKRLDKSPFNALKGLTTSDSKDKIKKAKDDLLEKDLDYLKSIVDDYNEKIKHLKSIDVSPLTFDEYFSFIEETNKKFKENLNGKKR